ncbi:membrane protein [Neptunitalea chrysea]|uniref:Membrane protein n=2 Tax=Neptunitalea chrysea TaxID=1647581 RepID=A0A9W6B594_9FLAO|nr:membrane protein [Neptunitalea chrysea]
MCPMKVKLTPLNSCKEFFNKNITLREIVFFTLVLMAVFRWVSPPMALVAGILVAQFIGHPFLHLNHKLTHVLLQISVVGLGFGMNVSEALHAGKQGFLFTIASITITLILGYLLSRIFKINKKTSFLISSGTAICGGSAIAAVSPVIKASEKQISVALGVVFILNSVALLIFPVIGQWLGMSQQQFGLWSAIAIHDTSSVVGAAAKYGEEALKVATTVKLARALWIIPVSLIAPFLFKTKKGNMKIPYFIGLFVVAMIINTYVPGMQYMSDYITEIAKGGLTLTLFLIGCGLSASVLKSVGVKPFVQGVLLWSFVSIASLWVILLSVG